jgi:mannosyltransferase
MLRIRLPTWVWVAAAATLVALVLSSLWLGHKSFWLDEAMSVHYATARRGLRSIALADGGNFALYYVLLHAWLLLGSSDVWVRALSVVPAVLSVPCMFVLASRLFGERTALYASFALAVNPFFVAYAQEARGYSLLLLASIVCMLFFVRLLDKPRSFFDALGYVCASVAMVYVHFFGIFVLAAQALTVVVFARSREQRRVWAGSTSVIIVMLIPLAIAAAHRGTAQIDWIPGASLTAVGAFLAKLAGGWPVLVVDCALIAWLLFSHSRVASNNANAPGSLFMVVAWLCLPIVLSTAVSIVALPILQDRYLIIVAPALALLAGAGAAAIPHRAMAIVAGVLFLGCSADGLAQYYASPKEDWRGAASFLTAHWQPGDLIACAPQYACTPLAHALGQMPNDPVVVPSIRIPDDVLERSRRVWLVTRVTQRLRPGSAIFLAQQRAAIVANLTSTKQRLLTRSFYLVVLDLYQRSRRLAASDR